jgi:hypothetical protein
MTTIDAKQFQDICDRVWTERAMVLRGRGRLSGGATLMRAVFWRLCKAGLQSRGCSNDDASKPPIDAYQIEVNKMLETNARPAFDGKLILNELVARYENEFGNGLAGTP